MRKRNVLKKAAAGILILLLMTGLACCGRSGVSSPVSPQAAALEEDAGSGTAAPNAQEAGEDTASPNVQDGGDAQPCAGTDGGAEDSTGPGGAEGYESAAAVSLHGGKGSSSAEERPQESAPAAPHALSSGAQESGPRPAGALDTASEAAGDEAPAARVTIRISCGVLAEDPTLAREEKRELIPADGVLLGPAQVPADEGDTVYDVLVRAAEQAGLALEEKRTPVSVYIRSIGGLGEFDAGAGSGWMYKLNGTAPNAGCGRVSVKDGDEIEWYYVI